MPETYTYTWTQTRLETVQDQFRYFLTYANFNRDYIDNIVYGVGEKVVQAVGMYGCDSSGLRVIEVELRVDWELSAKLTLTAPVITSGLSGWDGTQAPEVKVAGRRFATTVEEMALSTNFWVSLVDRIRNNSSLNEQWERRLGLAGTTPKWKSTPKERSETFLDLGEANIYMRRAGDYE